MATLSDLEKLKATMELAKKEPSKLAWFGDIAISCFADLWAARMSGDLHVFFNEAMYSNNNIYLQRDGSVVAEFCHFGMCRMFSISEEARWPYQQELISKNVEELGFNIEPEYIDSEEDYYYLRLAKWSRELSDDLAAVKARADVMTDLTSKRKFNIVEP